MKKDAPREHQQRSPKEDPNPNPTSHSNIPLQPHSIHPPSLPTSPITISIPIPPPLSHLRHSRTISPTLHRPTNRTLPPPRLIKKNIPSLLAVERVRSSFTCCESRCYARADLNARASLVEAGEVVGDQAVAHGFCWFCWLFFFLSFFGLVGWWVVIL